MVNRISDTKQIVRSIGHFDLNRPLLAGVVKMTKYKFQLGIREKYFAFSPFITEKKKLSPISRKIPREYYDNLHNETNLMILHYWWSVYCFSGKNSTNSKTLKLYRVVHREQLHLQSKIKYRWTRLILYIILNFLFGFFWELNKMFIFEPYV